MNNTIGNVLDLLLKTGFENKMNMKLIKNDEGVMELSLSSTNFNNGQQDIKKINIYAEERVALEDEAFYHQGNFKSDEEKNYGVNIYLDDNKKYSYQRVFYNKYDVVAFINKSLK